MPRWQIKNNSVRPQNREKETSRSIFRRTGINRIQSIIGNFLQQVENNNNINEHFFISFKGNKITHEGVKTSLDKLVKLSGGNKHRKQNSSGNVNSKKQYRKCANSG